MKGKKLPFKKCLDEREKVWMKALVYKFLESPICAKSYVFDIVCPNLPLSKIA
ncbi:hypothetical protein ZEAMMB73_Zm00001d030867 [Zea mays]|uniref:Uncharacterized protein n=1 Tax=Zea mays TaxID=4577 RepID=A0A1D6KEQ8_MAIZE|nr:hypothetical protein ZEAMMB73_Zm00001d030867 [Zea mays]